MKKYDIVSGVYSPPWNSDIKGQRFKFIALYPVEYGVHKGEWLMELYETDNGDRIHSDGVPYIYSSHIEGLTEL